MRCARGCLRNLQFTIMDDFIERPMTEREEAVWRRGRCPICYSNSLREKGTFDACNDCAARIGILSQTEMTILYSLSSKAQFNSSIRS